MGLNCAEKCLHLEVDNEKKKNKSKFRETIPVICGRLRETRSEILFPTADMCHAVILTSQTCSFYLFIVTGVCADVGVAK